MGNYTIIIAQFTIVFDICGASGSNALDGVQDLRPRFSSAMTYHLAEMRLCRKVGHGPTPVGADEIRRSPIRRTQADLAPGTQSTHRVPFYFFPQVLQSREII
jgi:hypothetical protein